MSKHREGSTMALLILLLFSASASTSAAVYQSTNSRLRDAALSKMRRERIKSSTERNIEEILRIKNLYELATPAWGEGTGARSARSLPERAIKAFSRQYPPDAGARHRCEDIFYIALLCNGVLDNGKKVFAFPEQKMTEEIETNVVRAMTRLLPEWGKERSEKSVLILIDKFEDPYTSRWMLVPSLKHLSSVVRNAPLVEQIFRMLLFGRPYAGIGIENMKRVWERLRRIEMSNTGRDSLGFYPGNTIF
jgi:hypothetical protein